MRWFTIRSMNSIWLELRVLPERGGKGLFGGFAVQANQGTQGPGVRLWLFQTDMTLRWHDPVCVGSTTFRGVEERRNKTARPRGPTWAGGAADGFWHTNSWVERRACAWIGVEGRRDLGAHFNTRLIDFQEAESATNRQEQTCDND